MDLRSSTPVSFLYVSDRARAIRFYCETLGLELRSSDPFGDFIATGEGLIRMTPMPDRAAGPHPVLGWEVEDIHSVVLALGERGIEFARYEGMDQDSLGVWTAPDNGNKVAWFNDPDGNVLSLSSR